MEYPKHQVAPDWTVEIADFSVFIAYKGFDVISFWPPSDGPGLHAFLQIAHAEQFRGIDSYDGTEWSVPGQITIELDDQEAMIDIADAWFKLRDEYPVSIWQADVMAGKTQLGYEEWLRLVQRNQ